MTVNTNETSHNVFLSWSGDRSKAMAAAMSEWLPNVIQSVVPWYSPRDIDAGASWQPEIATALRQIKVGVFFLTPENLDAPWLLFEAGAMSKALSDRTYVCTYLLEGLSETDIEGPLAPFNHTKADERGTLKLLKTISKAIAAPISDSQIEIIFELFWPQMKAKLEKLPNSARPRKRRTMEAMVEEILKRTRSIELNLVSGSRSLSSQLLHRYAKAPSETPIEHLSQETILKFMRLAGGEHSPGRNQSCSDGAPDEDDNNSNDFGQV